jgi:hypothetical protein
MTTTRRRAGFAKGIGDGTVEAISRLTEIGVGSSFPALRAASKTPLKNP